MKKLEVTALKAFIKVKRNVAQEMSDSYFAESKCAPSEVGSNFALGGAAAFSSGVSDLQMILDYIDTLENS